MQIPSLSNVALLVVIVACSGSTFAARKIRNTGGAVVFEEHYTVPELLFQVPYEALFALHVDPCH